MTLPALSGIEIQDRDLEILCGLFESRLMTLSHVAALFFDGRSEAAKKRIQRLKAAGLIAEKPRKPREPSVLFLTRSVFELLKAQGALDAYPRLTSEMFERRSRVKELTLCHELEVMDVKAAMVSAIRATRTYSIAQFSTWPLLHEFQAFAPDGAQVTVKPDGFIRIQEKAGDELYEHTFFLELDRSTETQDRLAAKAYSYRDYYRRGGMAVANQRPRSEYEKFPFRVLFVLKNAERRNNAAERLLLLQPPILSQVWLTTFAEVTTNPLGSIWIRPMDYRAALAGTSFEATGRHGDRPYRRQVDREVFIEERIARKALLTADDQ